MPKSANQIRSERAAQMQKPWTGTAQESPTRGNADELRDQVEVDHALGVGAYDRIRAGSTSS